MVYGGDHFELRPGQELTFGRGSDNDIVVDANPRLHRKFGHLSYRDGTWWVRNRGSRLAMTILDQASRSNATLTSGRETSLTFRAATITFEAGAERYELTVERVGVPDVDELFGLSGGDTTGSRTIDQSQLPLVGDQRLLAVALAETKLRNPHKVTELPTNKSIAYRFGWSMTTFNRKLDRLCSKYARAGVSGLVGDPGDVAMDRRTKLVEFLVESGIVTPADLALLADAVSETRTTRGC